MMARLIKENADFTISRCSYGYHRQHRLLPGAEPSV